jgi:hypothetical protein
LEKLAKRKTKKTRLSSKQGTAEYAVLDQVIKCWFAKAGEYWPGQIVGTREYTQSSILRNTETAPTHQSVSYLNAFHRCDPSIPGRPCCRIQGESPDIIAFPGAEPF